jgi:hypothetical protein
MRAAAKRGDDICKQLDERFGYNNAKLVTNSRRSLQDEVRSAVLDALSTNTHRHNSPVSAGAFKAMSERVVSSTASDNVKAVANHMSDFNRRNQELAAKAEAYRKAHPIQRTSAPVANADNPAFRAMHGHQGDDAVLAAIKARRG